MHYKSVHLMLLIVYSVNSQWTYTQHKKPLQSIAFMESVRLVASTDGLLHVCLFLNKFLPMYIIWQKTSVQTSSLNQDDLWYFHKSDKKYWSCGYSLLPQYSCLLIELWWKERRPSRHKFLTMLLWICLIICTVYQNWLNTMSLQYQ